MVKFFLKLSILLNIILLAYIYYGHRLLDTGINFLQGVKSSTEDIKPLREVFNKEEPAQKPATTDSAKPRSENRF
ncbi:MAG: hypothetical protein A2Y14_00935 [Verrucomicrobia bacterium GWF2_51_19]|nr:MAG: hypothetical protein A2Y14_00935 [Verrucomicrobia bacterium GWF2_51_19]HCJ12194.1 hypothetical protein [Opitutae bacterium]